MPEPSLRYVVVHLQGEMRTGRTEYLLGRNSRSELRDCRRDRDGDPKQPGAVQFQNGPLRAYIQNRDLRYHFHLDLESRVYTARRVNEYGSGLKPKGKPPPTFRPDRACAHGND